jgi:hypothetical protein
MTPLGKESVPPGAGAHGARRPESKKAMARKEKAMALTE